MWSSWSESAKSSLTQALEKTGDAISKAATQAGKSAAASPTSATSAGTRTSTTEEHASTTPTTTTTTTAAATSRGRYQDATPSQSTQQELLGNLQAGWSSVLESTKASIKTAAVVVEEQQHKLQENLKEQQHRLQEKLNEARAKYYKRDPKLPLDVVALKDAEVVYITDRIITMSHPAMASASNGEITGERKLAAVGHLLQQRHNGRYMVWNISEVEYETRILDEQVLTFSFPGSPSPPLGLLLKLLISMEAWLKADDRNVAVVHCLTGKGRTSTVVAAFLCWMGQAGFADIYQALEYVAACKQMTVAELTIPSQRRYASYFKNMLDGVRPSQPPLMLKRIIMSEAPRYARGPPRADGRGGGGGSDDNKTASTNINADPTQLMGCAPYLQIFKAGNLLYTAPASLHYQQNQDELPFVQVADGSVSFNINLLVQGDILVRCRHLTSNRKQRVSMFRAAFHTGYVPPKVLRLKKSELDGACSDDRFPDDFFLDLIFEAVDAEEASKLMQQQEEESSDHFHEHEPVHATKVSTASTYDSMLHRDSRFWDVIATRRQEQAVQHQQQEGQGEQTSQVPQDPMFGPTIGRRRDLERKKKKEAAKDPAAAASQAASAQKTALETFSIGGELDFLPSSETSSIAEEPPVKAAAPLEPPKKDSLMEALMGALDDESEERGDVEAIEFEDDSEPSKMEASTDTVTKSEVAQSEASGVKATSLDPSAKPASQEDNEVEPEGSSEDAVAALETTTTATRTTAQPSSDDAQVDDMEALLADANLNLDGDMDALLAEAGDTDDVDADLLDFDDTDLEDLENLLSPAK